ncbi:MAG: glycosyltransferase family 39 protein [Acidobacteriota bacterium]
MPESSQSAPRDRRQRGLLVAILVIGALLRLTYLLEVTRAPDFDLPQFEAQYHDYWARALLSGDWTPPAGVTDPEIPQRPYFRPPGYPFALAAVYAVTGGSYGWPRLLQMALGLLSCWLLFRLARRIYGEVAALCSAVLAAVYWLFIFFEAELMAVTLLIFLLIVAWTLAARWVEGFTLRRAVSVGIALGVAALVRPNAAVLVPAFLLWAAWLTVRRHDIAALRRRVFCAPALAFALAFVLTTLPATLRNLRVAGDAVWITSNAGINLFVGTHPQSDGMSAGVAELGQIAGLEAGWDSFDYPLVAAGVERLFGRPMADSEVSAYFSRRALDYAQEQPEAVLRLMVRKLALFFGPAEISNNKILAFERRASPTLSFGPSFATLLALALLGLGWLGWEWRRPQPPDPERSRRLELTALLLASGAIYSLSFLPFFVSARFRAPIVPLLILFAGYGLSALIRAGLERRTRALVTGLVLLLGARALTGVAWVPTEPDLSLWHWRKGLLWKAKGDADRARAAFQEAVAADPEDAEARLSLAESLAAAGKIAAAITEYRATLELPTLVTGDAIVAHNNLAGLLARGGDLAGAIGHWSAVLELDPNRVSALNNLAYALATAEAPELRDPARAVELAERAVELTGRQDPRPLATLDVARHAAGEHQELADSGGEGL